MGDLAKASKTLLITYTTCSPHSSLTFFSFSFFWVQHLAYTRQRKESPNPSRSLTAFFPFYCPFLEIRSVSIADGHTAKGNIPLSLSPTKIQRKYPNCVEKKTPETKRLHRPGIEPGSVPWQGTILPLDHRCFGEHIFGIELDNTFSRYNI